MAFSDLWRGRTTTQEPELTRVEMEVASVGGSHQVEVVRETEFRETHDELWGRETGERAALCVVTTEYADPEERGSIAVFVVEADGETVRRQVGYVAPEAAALIATDIQRAGGVVSCNGTFSRTDALHVWRTFVCIDPQALREAADERSPESASAGVTHADTSAYGNLWLTGVGEQHHRSAHDQLLSGEIGRFCVAGELIREPDNEFDSNAIAVHVVGVGRVAYLSGEDAATNAPLLDERGGQLPVGIRLNRTAADHHWAVIAVSHGQGNKIAVPKRRKSLSFPEAG